MKNNNYQKYFDKFLDIISQNRTEKLSESEIDAMFKELIECIPNNGKLYKYRNFLNRNNSFDNTYKSLKEGYIWLANTDGLNDKIDVTLNVNLERELANIQRALRKHKKLLLVKWLRIILQENKIKNEFSDEELLQIANCYTSEGRAIKGRIRNYLREKNIYYTKVDKLVKDIAAFVEEKSVGFEKYVFSIAEKMLTIPYQTKNYYKIFCVAEKPTIESMWAYYSNESNGFCIEYDFSKALSYNSEVKSLLLNMFKVNYKKVKPTFSLVEIIEEIIINSSRNENNKKKINIAIYEQLLTKSSDWKHEQEWRILPEYKDNRFNVDLVSGIYIDSHMISTTRGQKLIRLARKKGWKIIERRLSITKNCFEYVELKNK